MSWLLAIVRVVFICVIIFVASVVIANMKKETERQKRWAKINNGLCPNCDRETLGTFPNLVCPACGRLSLEEVEHIEHI